MGDATLPLPRTSDGLDPTAAMFTDDGSLRFYDDRAASARRELAQTTDPRMRDYLLTVATNAERSAAGIRESARQWNERRARLLELQAAGVLGPVEPDRGIPSLRDCCDTWRRANALAAE